MKNMEILREQWMWNKEARSILLWSCIVIGIVLTAAIYPSQGHLSLAIGLGPFILVCIIIGPIYRYVGTKVQSLKKSATDEDGDMAEALSFIGKIQSPAIVIMKEKELVLIPIVGW